MKYITLQQLKQHLCIDQDFHGDDNLLQIYGEVAEKTVQRHVCCVLSSLEDGDGNIPSPLVQAILLYAGVLYNSRESVAFGGSPTDIPHTYEYLINLYKNYSDTTSDDFVNSVIDDLGKVIMIIDTDPELKYGTYGNLVINNELQKKTIQKMAEDATIDENGNLVTDIERI